MKLRTEMIDGSPYSDGNGDTGNQIDDAFHDAAAAHALMQAADEIELDGYQDDEMEAVHRRAVADIRNRADELMREWGFDSGEVEDGRIS